MQKQPTARRSGAPANTVASRWVRERMPTSSAPANASRNASGGREDAWVTTSVRPAEVNTSLALGWMFSNKTIRVMNIPADNVKDLLWTIWSGPRRVPPERKGLCAGLEAYRLTVAPAVAGRHITMIAIGFGQTPDELARAEIHIGIVDGLQAMAQGFQPAYDVGVHAGLDIQREVAVDLPARRAACRLRLLVVIDHADKRLHMALRLHVAPHDAKAHYWLAVAAEKARNNGVERTLAAFHHIGRLRIHRKAHAPILQADGRIGHNHA